MNYSDKIFEMLGVKPKELFSIRRENGTYYYYINDDLKIYNAVDLPSISLEISDILNGKVKINKIVKYTEEEQLAIDYAKACGAQWIAKDLGGEIWGYSDKPIKQNGFWRDRDNYEKAYQLYLPISFIHWEDEEPYYIGD